MTHTIGGSACEPDRDPDTSPVLPRRAVLQAAAGLALSGAAGRPTFAQGAAPASAAPSDAPLPGAEAILSRHRPPGVALVAARIGADGVRYIVAPAQEGAATKVDADSRFEYGSVSKTFVALLLADHVVRGELALADPVERSLPDGLRLRDSAGAAITWADIATHRSGLPRLPDNFTTATQADPYVSYDEAALKRFLRSWQPARPRDSVWAYSNLGYGLIGQALAWRAGKPFEPLLRERVLTPLGLDEVQLSRKPVPGLVAGHDAQGKPVPAWHFDALAGAGALVGSARSLARYAQAAVGLVATPLAPAFKLALTMRADGPNTHNRIGLAWIGVSLGPRELRLHDGATAGHMATLCVEPGLRQAAVVLGNQGGSVSDLALHLMEPSLPVRDLQAEQRAAQEATSAEALTLPPEALPPLAGRYALNPQFALEVRVREGRLFAQGTGQPEFELFAKGPRVFFARVTPLALVFEDAPAGRPAPQLTLQQGGQTLVFKRSP